MQKDTKKLLAVLLLMGTAGMLQSMEVKQWVVDPIKFEDNEINVARTMVFGEIRTLKRCIEDLLQKQTSRTITLDKLIKKAITIEKRRKAFKSTLPIDLQPLAYNFLKEVGFSFKKLYINVLRQYNNTLRDVAEKAQTPGAMDKATLRIHCIAFNYLHNELLDAGEDFFTFEAEKISNGYLDIIDWEAV